MSRFTRLRQLGVIACISIGLTLLLDIMIGSSILSLISGSSEKYYRIRHHVYHHTLRENVDTDKALWGSTYYRVCTNRFGFKSRCGIQDRNPGKYDIGFIGDSFTEGIGMPYSDSFVGMVDANFPDLSVANLAVTSYSPKIYLSKIKHLLRQGIYFDHLFVFIDISDIMDDGSAYVYQNGYVYDAPNGPKNSDTTIDSVDIFFYNLKVSTGNNFPITYKLLRHTVRGTINALTEEPRNPDQPTDNKNLQVDEKTVFNFDRSAWTYDFDNPNYGPHGVEEAVNQSLQYMIELHELLASQGIELSVGIYPWPGQLAHDTAESRQVHIWSDFCETRCAHFVSLFPFFFEQIEKHGLADTYEKYYIDGDVHFNKQGNTVIANAIADQLRMSMN